MSRRLRVATFALALVAASLVAALIYRGVVSHVLTLAWLAATTLYVLATRLPGLTRRQSLRSASVLLLAAVLPVAVRAANTERDRLHMDEYLTGYFSVNHDFAHTSLFAYMPERWEWQGQFPKPFFLLQRFFFALFGKSSLSLHFSTQIYVAAVSVMLFLIVRELFDPTSAFVAVSLYAFFAPAVYHETLGLMFISSTAILAVFFYFAMQASRTGEISDAALAGVACGLCYLTYYSSYLAFPLLACFFAVHWLRQRSVRVVQNFVIALGGMAVVVAPFVAAFFRVGDYVSRRSGEISLLHGAWSPYREAMARGQTTPLAVLRENLGLCLSSFVHDGIGGHGGYDFGHLAFFDRFSLWLLLTGIVIGLILMWRRTELLFVFLLIGAAFVSGMVLTTPPPAYHRFSIAFPFLAILMTLPFHLLFTFSKLSKNIRYALAVGLLLIYAAVNQRHFSEAVFRDQSADDLRLTDLLDQRYGGRKIYVAAFPSFGFAKVLYFRSRWKGRPVETDFHDELLRRFNPREKYVYVIILADHFRERFKQADPAGRFVRFSTGYSLFAN